MLALCAGIGRARKSYCARGSAMGVRLRVREQVCQGLLRRTLTRVRAHTDARQRRTNGCRRDGVGEGVSSPSAERPCSLPASLPQPSSLAPFSLLSDFLIPCTDERGPLRRPPPSTPCTHDPLFLPKHQSTLPSPSGVRPLTHDVVALRRCMCVLWLVFLFSTLSLCRFWTRHSCLARSSL